MKIHKLLSIIWLSICIILVAITYAWSKHYFSDNFTNSWITFTRFVGLIILNSIINHTILDHQLSFEDKLLDYPWYKLVLTSLGIIGAMIYIDSPFAKLTASFWIASIILGRDHRWSGFLVIDVLCVIVVMLIVNEQHIANNLTPYLYYFATISALTSLNNEKKYEHQDK